MGEITPGTGPLYIPPPIVTADEKGTDKKKQPPSYCLQERCYDDEIM